MRTPIHPYRSSHNILSEISGIGRPNCASDAHFLALTGSFAPTKKKIAMLRALMLRLIARASALELNFGSLRRSRTRCSSLRHAFSRSDRLVRTYFRFSCALRLAFTATFAAASPDLQAPPSPEIKQNKTEIEQTQKLKIAETDNCRNGVDLPLPTERLNK